MCVRVCVCVCIFVQLAVLVPVYVLVAISVRVARCLRGDEYARDSTVGVLVVAMD